MAAILFIAGLFVGSFLNVCICRIPEGRSVVFPPSGCPACGRRLGAAELVPVLSFIVQRGRCRGCGGAISWRYPVVELLFALVLAVLYSFFPGAGFLKQAFFYGVLLVVFFIDLEHQIIPNRLVLLLFVYAVFLQLFAPVLPWGEALIGALSGGGLFLLLAVVSRGGMGGGDIKLVTVLGLWFGWRSLLLLLFLSFLGGGVVSGFLLLSGLKKRKEGIPFGPFLVLASFVISLWGERIISWYLRLSGL